MGFIALCYCTSHKKYFHYHKFLCQQIAQDGNGKKHQFLQSQKSWLVSCSTTVQKLSNEMVVPVLILSCRQSKISALGCISKGISVLGVFPGWEMLTQTDFLVHCQICFCLSSRNKPARKQSSTSSLCTSAHHCPWLAHRSLRASPVLSARPVVHGRRHIPFLLEKYHFSDQNDTVLQCLLLPELQHDAKENSHLSVVPTCKTGKLLCRTAGPCRKAALHPEIHLGALTLIPRTTFQGMAL